MTNLSSYSAIPATFLGTWFAFVVSFVLRPKSGISALPPLLPGRTLVLNTSSGPLPSACTTHCQHGVSNLLDTRPMQASFQGPCVPLGTLDCSPLAHSNPHLPSSAGATLRGRVGGGGSGCSFSLIFSHFPHLSHLPHSLHDQQGRGGLAWQ